MKRVFSFKKLLLFLVALIIICASIAVGVYFYLIGSPNNKSESKVIYIEEGSSYSTIATKLKENNLIKSELAYKVYIKLNPPKETLEYGEYVLKTNYDLEEMISILEKGSVSLAKTVSVTFVEGKNMRYVIKKITENFNITEKEVLNKLKDNDYLDTLINDYWFLTDEIKNENIYYSLEGYLYPDTYEFYESADVDDILRKMLDNMSKKLEPLKEDIESSKYTLHQMLTLSSIIELEAGNAGDRKGVAGVFYNRLEDNWSLGSDVTARYAIKLDEKRALTDAEFATKSPYNTRLIDGSMNGKLPVGPISTISKSSIDASFNPDSTPYMYFISNIETNETFYYVNESDFLKKKAELKNVNMGY